MEKNSQNHEEIRNSPPIGVTGPKKEKEIPDKDCVAKRYIEPENRITPIVTIYNSCVFIFSETETVVPANNKNNA